MPDPSMSLSKANQNMKPDNTLSKRGTVLYNSPIASAKQLFNNILNDAYEPIFNSNGWVNLGTAENFASIPDVVDFVNGHDFPYEDKLVSYGEGFWGTIRLRKALAKFMEKQMHAVDKIDPEDILVATGITSICEMLAFTICDPNDGILFASPMYGGFAHDMTARAHAKQIFVKFGDIDQFSADAVAKYEAAIIESEAQGTRIRALMLVNPHNPLSRCSTRESIIGLMKLCQKYGIHLLCDEVYAASVYDVGDPQAVQFTSALSFDHTPYIDAKYLHVLYGMSKDLASGGLRIGAIYSRNEGLLKAMLSIGMFNWPTAASQQVAAAMLEDEEWHDAFLERSRTKLAARNKLVRQLMDEAGIPYSAGANSGFFMWLDLRSWLPANEAGERNGWEQEQELFKALMAHKVFMNSGKELAAESPGYFRLVFSQEEQTLREGLKRLVQVLEGMNQA